MSMKSTKSLKIVLGTIIIGILGITIAYGALSSTLNVTVSKVTQNALTWNVGFTGSSATPTSTGTSTTGRTCGNATITSTTVTIPNTTTLSKPQDVCRYTLTIKNSGGIGAKLTSITFTPPTDSNKTCTKDNSSSEASYHCVIGSNSNGITYKITSDADGNTLLPINTTLNAGASTTVYLFLSYYGNGLNSAETSQSGAKFTLNYGQA
ncbi:MAG: hypothetical protein IJ568_07065 [Bacilli bacterium]|nr:hypothetical protein [Bacilli bacterium]